MPPARGKKGKKTEEPAVELPPVIFFLRIGKEFDFEEERVDIPAPTGAGLEYSDILLKTEAQERRFDESVVQDLMSKFSIQTSYPPGSACLWCCHSFSGESFVIPTHYDVYTNMYTAEGNYCSPECALSYIYRESGLTESDKWLRHSLLRTLYHPLYMKHDIQPAPDKRVLRMFGGNLDIQQYREFVQHCTKPLQLAMPPVRLYMPSVNTQSSVRDVKSYVSLSSETVNKASQQLRLKRSKPVHEGIPTLDKCLTSTAFGSPR
jgi:hypothetical protein